MNLYQIKNLFEFQESKDIALIQSFIEDVKLAYNKNIEAKYRTLNNITEIKDLVYSNNIFYMLNFSQFNTRMNIHIFDNLYMDEHFLPRETVLQALYQLLGAVRLKRRKKIQNLKNPLLNSGLFLFQASEQFTVKIITNS